MLESMKSLIHELALIPPGSHVLCAVSGGADSICLLHALYQLRAKLGFTLSAAHYNHQLRGEESVRDAVFVGQFVQLCCGVQRALDGSVLPAVSLYVGTGDVAGQAKAGGTGLEETARTMRYDFLQKTAAQMGADLIATAHTANDNAETILFHLARGSGLRGLGGIPPKRGRIIRPLLTTTRQEVEDYLFHYALPHMEDSSNATDDYTRNRIRHQILPVLEDVAPGFLSRIAGTAQLLRGDEHCLEAQARDIAQQAVPCRGGVAVDVDLLTNAPAPIAARAVRLLLARLWGGDQNCGSTHLSSILSLCQRGAPSAQLYLPNGSMAQREYNRLLLIPQQSTPPLSSVPLPTPGEVVFGPWHICSHAEPYQGQTQGPWEFWLRQDSIPTLTLRPRQVGDRLSLPGRPGKSVKKWMIEEKLPRFDRDSLPVFDCDTKVVGVAGLGADQSALPNQEQPAWHITITARTSHSSYHHICPVQLH